MNRRRRVRRSWESWEEHDRCDARLLAAALAATVRITAAPARGATTLRGRILGRPHVEGVHARVPVVLDARSARVLHARSAEAVLTVPARSGFRSIDRGRGAPDATRLGDIVSARVRGLGPGGAARSRYLRSSGARPRRRSPALAARLSASGPARGGPRRGRADRRRRAVRPPGPGAAARPTCSASATSSTC